MSADTQGIQGTFDQVMTRYLVVPDRPVSRCKSVQRLAVTSDSCFEPDNSLPRSARARPGQKLPGNFGCCRWNCAEVMQDSEGQYWLEETNALTDTTDHCPGLATVCASGMEFTRLLQAFLSWVLFVQRARGIWKPGYMHWIRMVVTG